MVYKMNFFHTFQDKILESLEVFVKKGFLPASLEVEKVTIEPPRDPTHGDVATNAALILAKATQKNPRDLIQIRVTYSPELKTLPERYPRSSSQKKSRYDGAPFCSYTDLCLT